MIAVTLNIHVLLLSFIFDANRLSQWCYSVQQPQSPPTVQTPVDVSLQSLTFSKGMSNEQLALWLRNHPSLSGADYEEDISKLTGTLPDTMLIINNYACNNSSIVLFRCQD